MNISSREAYIYKHHLKLWIAMKAHRTHKGEMLDFKHYKYLKRLYIDDADDIVVMKSTQRDLPHHLR